MILFYILAPYSFYILIKQVQLFKNYKRSYVSKEWFFNIYIFSIMYGYIILLISLFKYFYWLYALLIFIGGLTLISFITSLIIETALAFFLKVNLNEYLEEEEELIYPLTRHSLILNTIIFLTLIE